MDASLRPPANDVERPASALTPIPRREPASAEVTRRLLDYLLSGYVRDGDRIPPERQLSQALNVSRSAVREAIKSLSLLGLVEVRQGDGTYLTLLGERRVQDLMEARAHLEIPVAGLAAERRTDAHVASMWRIIGDMVRADRDLIAYVEADLSLHLTIAQASGNDVLSNLVGSVPGLLRVWAMRVLEAAGETATSVAVHTPIVQAIEQRDADAARDAMTAHMARATKRLQATLPGEHDAGRPATEEGASSTDGEPAASEAKSAP